MGDDTIRYFLFLSGRWRWRPTKAMRRFGFQLITMGRGGPELNSRGVPVPSTDDKARAIALNAEWDKVRAGEQPDPEKVYPRGSIGDGYLRAMKMREAERKARGIVWTKDQESRDDWPRAWKWIGPVFGDVDPRTVQPEQLLGLDQYGEPIGLRVKVAERVSAVEAHRVIKVWRALWKKMAAMDYCKAEADPSFLFANTAPPP